MTDVGMPSTAAGPAQPRGAGFERVVNRNCDPDAWADGKLVVMVGCDQAYLDEAVALLRSMDTMSPGFDFLLHLVNMDPDTLVVLDQLADELRNTRLHISAEKVRFVHAGQKRAYYASARFIRMAELLPRSAVPILALDADGLFVAPIDLDFSDKVEAEVCLRRRDISGEENEHLQVAAGAVWARPTEDACGFFRAVADGLLETFGRGEGEWFVDQAMLARQMHLCGPRPAIRNIKGKYADWSFRDDSIIWTGKGSRKYVDIRYLLLRLGYDSDPGRRDRARRLLEESLAAIPPETRGATNARALASLRRARPARFAIYLPRLDLPWKRSGLAKGGPPPLEPDVVDLRLWWKRFAMELARTMGRYGAEPEIVEIPAWEITPARVDEARHDLAFVPHRCRLDFAVQDTPIRFYMQEFFRHAFVADPGGWGASSSAYPVDAAALPPAVLGAWDDYRQRFAAGTLGSKFGQRPAASRAELEADGQLPSGPYAFFPLQVPHDQSLEYFSDVGMGEALDAVLAWAEAGRIALVLKAHPANRASMAAFRRRATGPGVTWSEAHVHDLLRHAQGVVTLNSGVGFEALLAGRPLVTLARGMYDTVGVAATPATLAPAWKKALAEDEDIRMQRYARFVDWYLARHAVDLSRPIAARHVLDRIVSRALAETGRREFAR